jgi:integrase
MVQLPHYLYKYPHSNNFYFKIRIPNQLIQTYSLVNQFFISSLRTSNKNNAQRLALMIKTNFDKDLLNMNFSEALQDLQEFREAHYEQNKTGDKWDFRAYLKSRFNEYLAWGKQMIIAETSLSDNLSEIKEVSPRESVLFSQYLQSSIDNNDMAKSIDLIAHKGYLLSYLEDYQAFTRSTLFQRANKPQNKNIPFSQSTAPEKDFAETGFGVDYFRAYPFEIYSEEPDAEAVKRFVARHASLEFDFKKSLVKELKKYEESYNSFDNSDFEKSSLSPTQLNSFEQMFDTLNETLKTIQGFKESEVLKEKQRNAVPIKPIAEKFMAEKSISTEPDTVRQYQIAFNFLYTIIGDDFDLTLFDRKKSFEIKEAVMAKQSNSEKGCNKETVSVATINKYLSNYGTFLNWCFSHDLINAKDLFEDMKIKETDKNTAQRRSYTQEEIDAIIAYQPKDKREAKNIRNDIFWFPKIALYTGMRLNEIALLTVDDFQVQDGIDFINLTDKNLKTTTSKRVVPVHSKLIKFGLLEFVKNKRAAGEKILFSQIREGKSESSKDGWAEPISKWFNRTLLRNIGADKTKEAAENTMLDFHAFRTSFVSILKIKGINDYVTRQIIGHSSVDVTYDKYGAKASTKMSSLKGVIEEVDY